METLRPDVTPNYHKQYDDLTVGDYMELPLSLIKPIITDDYTSPHTEGPIEVFKNRSGIIYIDDGNHRYFNYVNKLFIENGYKNPDLSQHFITVRKVYPVNSWMF